MKSLFKRKLNCIKVNVLILLAVCFGLKTNTIAQTGYNWKNVNIGGGSYVTGLIIHPKEKGLVYVKTDVGGSLRWNESEKRWIPLTDHFTVEQRNNYRLQAIALDPSNPDILYIVVMDGFLLKSTDRGENWIERKMDIPMGASLWWCTEPIKVDPFNSNTLIYLSRNREIFKSVNGGESWQSKGNISSSEIQFGILGLEFDPTKKGRIYANSFEDGIYESLDGGETWRLLEGSPKGVLKIALSKEGNLYTAGRVEPKVAKRNSDGTWQEITPQKFRSTGGKPPSTRRALADFNFCAIDINPFNSEHIVISVDYLTPNKLFQSLNGGLSWTEIKPTLNHTVPWWPKEWWGGGVADMKFDPHIENQVWFVDFKGIWRTEDILAESSVWTNLEEGHEEIVITSLIAPPAAKTSNGYILLTGACDVDGFIHYDLDSYPERKNGPPTYQHTYSVDYCANNPKYIVRVGESRALNAIGEFIIPEIDPNPFGGSISADEGRTWKAFNSLPITYGMLTRVSMSATDPDVILVMTGDGPLYRTGDGGNSWEEIKSLPGKGFGGRGYSDTRNVLVADRVNGQKFYFYDDGKIYRSTDGGKTFLQTPASLPVLGEGDRQNRPLINIKTVIGMEGEVWISLDKEGLFRSSDSGSSFARLKNVDKVLLFDLGKPLNGTGNPVLYLYGTIEGKNGIFRTLDFGKKWQDITPKNEVPVGSSPKVMEASKQNAGLVFIGTDGRGIVYGVPDDYLKVR